MAGNAVSIIAITSTGRGGRKPETLPRTANRSFTVTSQNSRYRCTNCNTILQKDPINRENGVLECPYCFMKNCIVTVTGRQLTNKLDKEEALKEIRDILEMEEANTVSIPMLAKMFDVTPPTMYALCESLSNKVKRKIKHNKRRKSNGE